MKTRLENLKNKFGIQWKDLADELGISVPMLGCLRRGERNPSQKVLRKIERLEKPGVVLHIEDRIDWQERAEEAEEKLKAVNAALELVVQAVEELRKVVR